MRKPIKIELTMLDVYIIVIVQLNFDFYAPKGTLGGI